MIQQYFSKKGEPELTPQVSESIQQQVIEQEITQADEIEIDNSAAVEQKENLKSETIVEKSTTTPEQTTDQAFTA